MAGRQPVTHVPSAAPRVRELEGPAGDSCGPGHTQDPRGGLGTVLAAEGAPSSSLGRLLWAPSWVPETGAAGALLRSPTAGQPAHRCPVARFGGDEGGRAPLLWAPRHAVGTGAGDPAARACPQGGGRRRAVPRGPRLHGTSPGCSDPCPQTGPLRDCRPSPQALGVTQGQRRVCACACVHVHVCAHVHACGAWVGQPLSPRCPTRPRDGRGCGAGGLPCTPHP